MCRALLALLVLAPLAGCGDDGAPPVTPRDAGGRDAFVPPGEDAGPADEDAGRDFDAGPMLDYQLCRESCVNDGDCFILGSARGFACLGGYCAAAACDEDICRAQLSGWNSECTSDGDCMNGPCVRIAGAGRCSIEGDCASFMLDTLTEARFSDGADVEVCGRAGTSCLDGVCTSEASMCPASPCGEGERCEGGRCVCTGDAGCGENQACYGGRCGCANDDACFGRGTCDTEDGICKCTEVGQCTAPPSFDGTAIVCE